MLVEVHISFRMLSSHKDSTNYYTTPNPGPNQKHRRNPSTAEREALSSIIIPQIGTVVPKSSSHLQERFNDTTSAMLLLLYAIESDRLLYDSDNDLY